MAKNEQPNSEQLWLEGFKNNDIEKKDDGAIDKFDKIDKDDLREIINEMLKKKADKSVAGDAFLCGVVLSYLDVNKINLIKKTREETDEFYKKTKSVLLPLLEEMGIEHKIKPDVKKVSSVAKLKTKKKEEDMGWLVKWQGEHQDDV